MSSRNVEDLYPQFRPIVNEFLLRADDILGDTQAFITDGFRSGEEQDKLYAQGRTTAGKIVTNAKAGQSAHNFGMAIDIAFRKDGTKGLSYDLALYKKLLPLAEELGLEWGGTWKSFPDNPHYQLPNWVELSKQENETMPEKQTSTTKSYTAEEWSIEREERNKNWNLYQGEIAAHTLTKNKFDGFIKQLASIYGSPETEEGVVKFATENSKAVNDRDMYKGKYEDEQKARKEDLEKHKEELEKYKEEIAVLRADNEVLQKRLDTVELKINSTIEDTKEAKEKIEEKKTEYPQYSSDKINGVLLSILEGVTKLVYGKKTNKRKRSTRRSK